MVLDVNFINPYKTAGFLFFDDKDDAKKTDNSVVKVKGCLVDVHVDINNLPVFPSDHQILIVSQCLMISWEKLFIDKIIRPKSNESMWYFRPLELLEGFFSSVFKLVVLEFIS